MKKKKKNLDYFNFGAEPCNIFILITKTQSSNNFESFILVNFSLHPIIDEVHNHNRGVHFIKKNFFFFGYVKRAKLRPLGSFSHGKNKMFGQYNARMFENLDDSIL